MATIAGSEGTVKLSNDEIAEIKSYSIELQGETTDSTSFDNGGWRTHKHTLKTWSGTLDAFWDNTDSTGQALLTIGSSVVLGFYYEGETTGDKYLTGTATVTAITRQANVDGLVEAQFSFMGNGVLNDQTVA